MNISPQVKDGVSLTIAGDNKVGLVKRLAIPIRNGNEIELIAILDVGVTANPRRLELPGNQQRRDFLIGPPGD